MLVHPPTPHNVERSTTPTTTPAEPPRSEPRLTPARMYRALLDRDPAFDGRFIVAVKTTSIFCRPTCTARKPLPENVEFFPSTQAALHAGYRACKRCRPMEDPAAFRAAPAWLTDLKRYIDEHPAQRLRDADLRTRGLDPSTVRRAFARQYGMTFQAYARSRRVGLALAGVRSGQRLTTVGHATGYRSESGLREAFATLFGVRSTRHPEPVLHARWLDTPLGAMLALADDSGLRLLDFVDRRGLERQIVRTRQRERCVIAPGNHPHLDAIARQLALYFEGKNWLGHDGRPLGIPLSPSLPPTPFQHAAWSALQRIPLGQTRTYAQQAADLRNPAAVRAVARANGENFLALVIPCHRVIGSDGSMTGYGGGVWRKQWLLEHEAAMAAASRT